MSSKALIRRLRRSSQDRNEATALVERRPGKAAHRNMVREIWRRCRTFRSNKRGNTAMMFGLMVVPFVGVLGLASDFGVALMDKSKLDVASDAAALAAVRTAQNLINSGGSTRSAAMAAGTAQAKKTFNANVGNLAFGTVPIPTFTWTAGTTGQRLSYSVTYKMAMANSFGTLFGVPTTTVAGTSASTTVLKPYYQFIFVVDISGSMAIGGTPTDITKMTADRRLNYCAFACHDPYYNRGPNYRAIAAAAGYQLKIDYVNSAIQNFINDLRTQTATVPGVFSVGIDTFATSFYPILSPTANMNQALTAAATIDVEPMAPLWVSQGYTRTTSSLNDALARVSNIGDGSSASSQQTYFIFLSDGVEDIEGNIIYGRGTDVSYTSACTTIKQAGATMISIIAPYPVVNDEQYPVLVKPLASQLVPTMQACATSPSWAFQATDGPGINTAVKSALQQIIQGLTRLTQ